MVCYLLVLDLLPQLTSYLSHSKAALHSATPLWLSSHNGDSGIVQSERKRRRWRMAGQMQTDLQCVRAPRQLAVSTPSPDIRPSREREPPLRDTELEIIGVTCTDLYRRVQTCTNV